MKCARPTLGAIGATLALASAAPAATIRVDAIDRGWYDQAGFHDPANDSYNAGVHQVFEPGNPTPTPLDLRDWFAFDLTGLSLGNIQSISLEVFYTTATSPGTFTVRDVTTPVSELVAGTGGTAAFADLGAGIEFGRLSGPQGGSGPVTIALNADFLQAFQGSLGGSIALGGAIDSGTVFGSSGTGSPADGRVALVIVDDTPTVPEPASMWTAGAILIGAVAARGRRRAGAARV